MDQVQFLALVRSLIRDKFRFFGSSADAVPTETMLIRNGYFCGRRFHCDGLQAVWFLEENELKFYDRDGAIMEVLEVLPENLPDTRSLREVA